MRSPRIFSLLLVTTLSLIPQATIVQKTSPNCLTNKDCTDLPPNRTLAESYPLKNGFPVLTSGQVTRSAPSVVDLNGDGQMEIIVGDYDGEIFAWDANGQLLDGFPLTNTGHIIGHLAFADLNNDGDMEIVAGIGSPDNGGSGYIYVWHPNGTVYSGWPKSLQRFTPGEPLKISSVVIADIEMDGKLDIIAATNNNSHDTPSYPTPVPDLYAWDRAGNLKSGWPVQQEPSILGTLAVGNVLGDEKPEIFLGRDAHIVYAYDYRGNNLAGWPLETYVDPDDSNTGDGPRIVHKRSAPTLADLDSDGIPEFIIAGQRKLPNQSVPVNTELMILRPNASRWPGWEVPASGNGIITDDYDMQQAPVVVDIDSDGTPEIVIATQDGYIRAYEPDKTLKWSTKFSANKNIFATEPVIGDVDNDNRPEIIFGTSDAYRGDSQPVGLWILEHDGTPKSVSPLPVYESGIQAPPTLADVDGDGLVEIIAASLKRRVYVWDTEAPYLPDRFPWPIPRYNLERTGFMAKTSPVKIDKTANKVVAEIDHFISYTITLQSVDSNFTETLEMIDVIPDGLQYVDNSLNSTHGHTNVNAGKTMIWSGLLDIETKTEITYEVQVVTANPTWIINQATVTGPTLGQFQAEEHLLVNGNHVYLPMILH